MTGLLDRQLLFVSGKGGTGKTSVAAALADLAVRQGKRTMVVQFQGQTSARAGSTVTLRIPPGACHLFSTATGEPALPPS